MRAEKVLVFWISVFLVIFIAGFSFLMLRDRLPFVEKNDLVQYKKIAALYDMKEYQKALDTSSDFSALYPDSKYMVKVLDVEAEVFYAQKDIDKTRMIIQKIFSDNRIDNSDFVTAAELLGEIGRDNGKYDPVVMNYLENAYLKSEGLQKPVIAGLLGYQALYSKDYKSAICYFNITSGEEGLIGRARVDIEQGNYPDAIQEYLNYFSLCPEGQRYDRVRDAFIKQSFYYALALKNAKEYKQAIQYYLNVVNTFPSDTAAGEGLLKIAGIYAFTGEYQKSADSLDKILTGRYSNCFEEALYNKAVLYYQWDKKNLSIKYFKDLQEKYPSGIFGSKAPDWIILIKKDIES